jgi:uncharacterized protein (TIGR02922 family)
MKKVECGKDSGLNAKQTVTILFCTDDCSFVIKSQVLHDLPVHNERVIVPEDFRKGKTIFAVLEGSVKILNTLGERAAKVLVA